MLTILRLNVNVLTNVLRKIACLEQYNTECIVRTTSWENKGKPIRVASHSLV